MRPPKYDAVIFDIDNVLIDTRRSYLESIRWTVHIYLTSGSVPFFHNDMKDDGPQPLSSGDVDLFKLLGGFNDDWDCCYGLLIYLLQLKVEHRTLSQLKQAINLGEFSRQIRKRPLHVSGMVSKFGRNPVVTIEKIARIFQEVYLGRNLFEANEKKKVQFWKKRGLILKEKIIFRKKTLEKIKAMGVRLGIATGRPRFEAIYALKTFGIFDLFEAITTIDEVKKAEAHLRQSLRKPHPFSLLETAKKMGVTRHFLYVGDLPDDILAALQAKKDISIGSVAFPCYSCSMESAFSEIQKAKPDFMIRKPAELLRVIKSGK